MRNELKQLPTISRDAEGRPYPISVTLRRRVKAMIRSECCNYESVTGECLLLDDGNGVSCPQVISNQILCRWFNHAVIPADKVLHAEIIRDVLRKRCAACGVEYVPGSNSAKYCPNCRKKVHRNQKTRSERKRRAAVDK